MQDQPCHNSGIPEHLVLGYVVPYVCSNVLRCYARVNKASLRMVTRLLTHVRQEYDVNDRPLQVTMRCDCDTWCRPLYDYFEVLDDVGDDDIKSKMESACIFGRLDVVKQLTDRFRAIMEDPPWFMYRFSKHKAFENACLYGHLEVAVWLYENGCSFHTQTDVIFVETCQHGCLDVAKWMVETFNIRDPDTYITACIDACYDGQLPTVKWLCKTFRITWNDFSMDILNLCAEYGHYFTTRQWFIDYFDIPPENDAQFCKLVESMSQQGHFDDLKRLQAKISCTPNVCDAYPLLFVDAVQTGNLEFVKWANDVFVAGRPLVNVTRTPVSNVLAWALGVACVYEWQFKVAVWLVNTFEATTDDTWEPHEAFEYAASNNNLVCAKWLCDRFGLLAPDKYARTREIAIRSVHRASPDADRNFVTIRWLHNQFQFTAKDIKGSDGIVIGAITWSQGLHRSDAAPNLSLAKWFVRTYDNLTVEELRDILRESWDGLLRDSMEKRVIRWLCDQFSTDYRTLVSQ